MKRPSVKTGYPRRKCFADATGIAILVGVVVSCFSIEPSHTLAQTVETTQSENLWTRTTGEDWSTFLGPTGDGKSVEKGVLKDWSKGKLKVVWKMEAGQGYGIGSVAKGRFYHFSKGKGRLGKTSLRCLNAETGNPIWNFEYESKYRDLYGYDNGPRTSPVIDGNRIYIFGVEGMLYCLDSMTGKEIWKVNTAKRFGVIQNFFGVASTPVIFDDLLIVMIGGSPEESKKAPPGALQLVKPNGTGVVAFDKKTGRVRYESVDDLASYASLKLADIDGEPVVLAWMRESLHGLNPKTGEVKFDFPWRARMLESVNASTPLVFENQVLISECYKIGSALLRVDGGEAIPVWTDKEKGRDKALEAHWNTPIRLGDSIFGCSGRHARPAELRCVDWATGKVNWSKPGLSRSSVTWIDDHFIVMGEEGDLLLIKSNSESYQEVTRYEAGEDGVKFASPCWAAPIVSHGLMYVRGRDQLVCFELIPDRN
ncbi:MAG: PQQ-binding-like beta-propeller repeat protein [Mariniblastus sp.]